ncbi:hypothetical protein [Mycobacterium tuberculosis]|uniref:hypothetical protein n=1 Tax=Mycobacterium tuberculosis TaxID=1773 RepID=UPI00045A6B88|nr:hypothetical protein AN79_02113 [Mycobacterium tuberculosis M1309]
MRNVVPEVGNRDSAVPVVLAGPVSSVIDEIVREGAQQMLAGAQRRCAASKLVRQRHETAILLGWLNRPGMSGDSSSWKGWGHVRWFIEEVPAGAA